MTRAAPAWLTSLIVSASLTGCTLITDSSQFLVDGAVDGMDAGPRDADAAVDAGRGPGPGDAGTDGGGIDAGPAMDAGMLPPNVVFLSGSVPDGGTTNLSRAEFAFVADPAGPTVEYECELESVTAGGTTTEAFQSCTSPVTYELLPAGLHTLSVRARNGATGFGPAAQRRWTLEARTVGIRDIQEGLTTGAFSTETLVQVDARVQRDIPASDGFRRAAVLADGDASTLVAASWRGILSEPVTGEPALPAGLEVNVVGTVREIDDTTWIVGPTYQRGAVLSPYAPFRTRDGGEVVREALEGVVVDLGGFVPSSNCASCFGPEPVCLHFCEGGCRPIRQRNLTSSRMYGRDGSYTGVLVDGGREVWVYAFGEQNDICL